MKIITVTKNFLLSVFILCSFCIFSACSSSERYPYDVYEITYNEYRAQHDISITFKKDGNNGIIVSIPISLLQKTRQVKSMKGSNQEVNISAFKNGETYEEHVKYDTSSIVDIIVNNDAQTIELSVTATYATIKGDGPEKLHTFNTEKVIFSNNDFKKIKTYN